MGIYKIPVRLADGSIRHINPGASGRFYVVDTDGSSIEITVDPDDAPPTGRAYVVDSDGSTRIYVSYVYAVSSMDLTTTARVKANLGGISSSASDSLIDGIVTDVSYRFERYMRRQVLRQAATATFPASRFSTILSLPAYPVTSITSIKYATHPSEFADATAMAATEYVLEDQDAGLVRFLVEMPLLDDRRPGYLQVVYTGGMAEDTDDFIATYPDVARAADVQCAYEFQRRNSPGGNATNDGGSTAFDGPLGLLESSRQALTPYRRIVIG